MKAKSPLIQIKFTEGQRKWLDQEKERTGNSITTIVKGLVQDKSDKKSR